MSESKDKENTGNPAVGRKPPSNAKDLSPLLRGSRSFDDYSSTSDEYIKEMTKAFNQRFVVEGGKCKCSEGTKEASIKATRVTSTTFGKACALTFSCTKMMEEEIFGKCRKLTFEKADKEGKAVLDISPVMCKGHYNPKPNKWKDPASTVGDNGEDIILLTSTLKCEHGGQITITSNGQGGKLKDSLGNMWFDQAVRGSYSEYDTIGGEILGGLMRINLWFNFFAAGRDYQHGYYNLDGDEMVSALLGVIPTFKAISLSGALPKLKDLKKLFKKDSSKKAGGRGDKLTQTQQVESFQNRIDSIRNQMPNSKLKNQGNMAVADVNIKNLPDEFMAHSKIHSPNSKGAEVANFSPSPENRIFESYIIDKFPRYNDTEAKILEDIASRINDPSVSGRIDLFTELPPCQSCLNIISEFKQKFPNIELNIFTK